MCFVGDSFGVNDVDQDVPFVAVFDALVADPVWRAEVAAGDGVHPGAAGCARLAALVAPAWSTFVPG